MIHKTLHIRNRAGLHTRPAAMLVKLSAKFKSNIQLERDGFEINAKSIVGVMTLAAEFGSQLELEVEGEDEIEAAEAIVELFDTGFGELT